MKKNSLYRFLAIAALFTVAACGVSVSEKEKSDLQNSNQNNLSSKSVELDVYGISAEAEQEESPALNAIDSDTSSRFSGFGNPLDLVLDLGNIQLIDYINIEYYKGSDRQNFFIVHVSANGSDWINIGSKVSSGNTNGLETFDLINSKAQYLKLELLGNVDNDWNSISDIEVYGTDLKIDTIIEKESSVKDSLSYSLDPTKISFLME